MRYMLDTNICIYIICKKPHDIHTKFEHYQITDFGVSTITIAELACGVAKSRAIAQNRKALDQFLIPLTVLDFDAAASMQYGAVRTALDAIGSSIGVMDLLIAAQALSQKLTVVTNSAYEFRRVPGLQVEEWFSS